MKQTAYFSEKPDTVKICVLPTGASDVWLRRNVMEERTPYPRSDGQEYEEEVQYLVEEAYMRTEEALDASAVQASFEEYWKKAEAWQPKAENDDQPSDHERLVALEAAMVDMLLGGGDDDDV